MENQKIENEDRKNLALFEQNSRIKNYRNLKDQKWKHRKENIELKSLDSKDRRLKHVLVFDKISIF